MVLIDTSVWIDFFRPVKRSWKEQLKQLLLSGRAAVIGPVIAELLYGARGDRERSRVLDLAATAKVLDTGLEQWMAAGMLGRALRKKGVTLSIVDCIVAAVAKEHGIDLWTLDYDFKPLFDDGIVRRFEVDL